MNDPSKNNGLSSNNKVDSPSNTKASIKKKEQEIAKLAKKLNSEKKIKKMIKLVEDAMEYFDKFLKESNLLSAPINYSPLFTSLTDKRYLELIKTNDNFFWGFLKLSSSSNAMIYSRSRAIFPWNDSSAKIPTIPDYLRNLTEEGKILFLQLLPFSNVKTTIIPQIIRAIMRSINKEGEKKWSFFSFVLTQLQTNFKQSKNVHMWYTLISLYLNDNDSNLETTQLWTDLRLENPHEAENFFAVVTTMFYKVRNELIRNEYVSRIEERNKGNKEFPENIKQLKELLLKCFILLLEKFPDEHIHHFIFPQIDEEKTDTHWLDVITETDDITAISNLLAKNPREHIWMLFYKNYDPDYIQKTLTQVLTKNSNIINNVTFNVLLYTNNLDNSNNKLSPKQKNEIIIEGIIQSKKFYFSNRFLYRKGPRVFVKELFGKENRIAKDVAWSIFNGNVWLRRYLFKEMRKGLTKYTSIILSYYWLLSKDFLNNKVMINKFLGEELIENEGTSTLDVEFEVEHTKFKFKDFYCKSSGTILAFERSQTNNKDTNFVQLELKKVKPVSQESVELSTNGNNERDNQIDTNNNNNKNKKEKSISDEKDDKSDKDERIENKIDTNSDQDKDEKEFVEQKVKIYYENFYCSNGHLFCQIDSVLDSFGETGYKLKRKQVLEIEPDSLLEIFSNQLCSSIYLNEQFTEFIFADHLVFDYLFRFDGTEADTYKSLFINSLLTTIKSNQYLIKPLLSKVIQYPKKSPLESIRTFSLSFFTTLSEFPLFLFSDPSIPQLLLDDLEESDCKEDDELYNLKYNLALGTSQESILTFLMVSKVPFYSNDLPNPFMDLPLTYLHTICRLVWKSLIPDLSNLFIYEL
eukprot:TRINITY_DN12007_c0_g1_i1.p1 TRINITY_DN12007_c0_g1~~TRINITY_DN12007_c0_g1_i1.p1  ORF type:complete len:888 (+),score=230.35 TRINITY_DN12007_c0_g1_i1:79-2664(+)